MGVPDLFIEMMVSSSRRCRRTIAEVLAGKHFVILVIGITAIIVVEFVVGLVMSDFEQGGRRD